MPLPKIVKLCLPQTLPTADIIRAHGNSEKNYEHEDWEIEYLFRRYLNRVEDSSLINRHHSIIRNLRTFDHPTRHRLPIQNWRSTWYWYRKEHETRLEFALRGVSVPTGKSERINPKPSGFDRRFLDGSSFIYRYGNRRYMSSMINRGEIRFSPACSYYDKEHNEARRDEEIKKTTFLPGNSTRLIDKTGTEIPIIGDIRHTIGGSNYHLCCFSTAWDPYLFLRFEADSCVIITSPTKLASRISAAGTTVFPGFKYIDRPIEYFDPYSPLDADKIFNSNWKDFRFSYQQEYRHIWGQFESAPVDGFHNVVIGPSHDIMKMVDHNGREINDV